MEIKPFKIFVSFHDKDDALYNAIKAAFGGDEKVQVYRRSLDVGDRRWIYDPEKLYDSLDRPDLAVAIISPCQRADPWFEHELPALFALERYLKSDIILPVLAGDVTDRQVPIYLRGRDYVDCRSSADDGVARLTELVTRARERRVSEVFLVHGHDWGAKDSVARVIERLGLEPVILHEQATRGMTIIEKLEHHADACFAVVILTADDVGASRKEKVSVCCKTVRKNGVKKKVRYKKNIRRDLIRNPLTCDGAWEYQVRLRYSPTDESVRDGAIPCTK